MAELLAAIEKLQGERFELERKIDAAVSGLLMDFERRTAISPCGVSISMTEVTSIDSRARRYVIGGVAVSIEV